MEGYTEVHGANLLSIVSDEYADSAQIGLRMSNLFIPLVRLPSIHKQFVPRITEASVQPFQRVVGAA